MTELWPTNNLKRKKCFEQVRWTELSSGFVGLQLSVIAYRVSWTLCPVNLNHTSQTGIIKPAQLNNRLYDCSKLYTRLATSLSTPVQCNVIQQQQLCHEFCFYEANNFSVLVDSVRKVIILLYVYYGGRSGWWCCTGVHYIERWF